MRAHLRENLFLYCLLPFIVYAVGASYVRFLVHEDYMVMYESECDAATEVCFVSCEDDECTQQYYYRHIQKYAPNLRAQCGEDITDCVAAQTCLPEDNGRCVVSYCDPTNVVNDCDTLEEGSETLPPQAGDQENGTEEALEYEGADTNAL